MGYDARWRKARRIHLASEPLCRTCKAEGRVTAATIVDHIVPHRGNYALFWDQTNWASICAHHHALKSTRERDEGVFWGRSRLT